MPERYFFSGKERIKSKKLIGLLFESGHSCVVHPVRIVWTITPLSEDVPCQVAVAVSKKNFANAVDRNWIKRRIREAWRHKKNRLEDYLRKQNKQMAVMVIYTSRKKLDYKIILDKLTLGINQLIAQNEDA